MEKEEMQKLWDEIMIDGWIADADLARCLLSFWGSIGNDISNVESVDLQDVADFFVDNKIRRVNGKSNNFLWRIPIRAFVAQRCQLLSDCMWSGKNSREQILENMSQFKWAVPRPKSKRRYRNGAHLKVKARDLSKKHDWTTVK